MTRIQILLLCGMLVLGACNGGEQVAQSDEATATLAPIVSQTPRFTATPVPTRTALPTFTYTPSETPISPTPSDTPTPTATPPITGIVASASELVNVRSGPGVTFDAIVALPPGTGVQILGQSADGRWLNIRMDEGNEGWIALSLVRINPTPTLVPTATPSPNLTALFLGTPLPTAILGGGTVTPTPPRSAVSPTPSDGTPAAGEAEETAESFIPVIDTDAFYQTATALAGGVSTIEPSATFNVTDINETVTAVAGSSITSTPGPTTAADAGATPDATQQGIGSSGSAGPQAGIDVFAFCNDTSYGIAPPRTLEAGATIDVFWAWFARTREQVQQHVDNAIYEVKVDGVTLEDWRNYTGEIRQQGSLFVVYWFVPYGPLDAGEHEITYQVTWESAISDGFDEFGPGTSIPFQQENCTFTVR